MAVLSNPEVGFPPCVRVKFFPDLKLREIQFLILLSKKFSLCYRDPLPNFRNSLGVLCQSSQSFWVTAVIGKWW